MDFMNRHCERATGDRGNLFMQNTLDTNEVNWY